MTENRRNNAASLISRASCKKEHSSPGFFRIPPGLFQAKSIFMTFPWLPGFLWLVTTQHPGRTILPWSDLLFFWSVVRNPYPAYDQPHLTPGKCIFSCRHLHSWWNPSVYLEWQLPTHNLKKQTKRYDESLHVLLWRPTIEGGKRKAYGPTFTIMLQKSTDANRDRRLRISQELNGRPSVRVCNHNI